MQFLKIGAVILGGGLVFGSGIYFVMSRLDGRRNKELQDKVDEVKKILDSSDEKHA